MDIGIETRTEKTKYMVKFRHENTEQYHNLLITKISFENVAKFKCMGTTVINKNHKLRVFENRMLRRTFRSMKEEVAGGWRRFHYEKLPSLYCSTNIIRITKPKRMRLAAHVARM
jgi:hypothetical protein